MAADIERKLYDGDIDESIKSIGHTSPWMSTSEGSQYVKEHCKYRHLASGRGTFITQQAFVDLPE